MRTKERAFLVKKKNFSTTSFIIVIGVALVMMLVVSLSFEIKRINSQYEKLALDTTRSYFNMIVMLRQWNALHNGVYVPVSDEIQPNPYLEDPLRDLETLEGMKLTKINPAFMTRLLSELATEELDIRFHIFSLQPINPKNAADRWEAEALKSFEEGTPDSYTISKSGSGSYFRYMAPVKVEASCLQCHAKQGYQLGDVKGGISVSLPYEPFQKALNANIVVTILAHFFFLFFLGGIILIFGNKTISAEKQVRKLSEAVEHSANSVVITDPNGRIEYVNPKFTQVTGYSATEVLGENPRFLKSGEQSDEYYRELWRTITSGKEWHGEFHNRRKDGELIWEKASIAPVRDRHGKIINYIAIKEDITRLKEVETERERLMDETRRALEQLQEVDRLKSELVNTVSHELRTPLASILGFAELLLKKSPGEEKARKYLATIHNEAVRLTGLINNFLDLQRIETGRLEFSRKPVELAALIRASVEVYQAHSDRHVIVMDLEEGMPPVWADPDRVTQVLGNLLSNAIKYSPVGGPVEVRASRRSPAEVEVAVRDHGLGIPEEAQKNLFQPFFRVDNSDRRQIGGTGLGLAICQRIIRALGGEIRVQSAHGEGSVFTFTLPVVIEQTGREDPAPEGEGASAGAAVLVVEDDHAMAEMLAEALEAAGYKTRVVDNGPVALAVIREAPPLAVILDLKLAGPLDGWEVLRSLKQDANTSGVPVIISSSLEKRQKGLELGAADYLVKPFPPDKLVESLRTVTRTAAGAVGLPRPSQAGDVEDLVKGLLEREGFVVLNVSNQGDLMLITVEKSPLVREVR